MASKHAKSASCQMPDCKEKAIAGGFCVMHSIRQKLTPPQLAKLWGISSEKVLGWIASGQLRAINAASHLNSPRPRFLIDKADIAAFEAQRSTQPEVPARRRRRRPSDANVIKFF
jgi:hypothetical protein